MRMLQVSVLALSVNMLVLGPVAHARHKPLAKPAAHMSAKAQTIGDTGGEPSIIDVWQPPDPVLFLFFFQHLANLDAAADSAVAAGNADASQWKTLEQRAIGLTDTEAAILKQVAYGCNQSLKDNDAALQALQAGGGTTVSAEPPAQKMDIVQAAVNDLQSQLGDEAFQAVGQYLQDNFAGEVQVVTTPGPGPRPGPVPPSSSVTPGTGGDLGPPVEATDTPSVSVLSHISKLSQWEVLAECQTTLDNTTAQSYISPLTLCTMQGSLTNNVPCDSPDNCVSVLPAGGPGASEWTAGTHGLRMQTGDCEGTAGLLDPLHYCPLTPPFVGPSGTIYPLGDSACYAGVVGTDNCVIATTVSTGVTFVAVDPSDLTIYPGGQQQFTINIPAHLGFSGPGTMDSTGLYKAPATIDSPQTASVTACDANPLYYDDCATATIHLQPFSVEVTPNGNEVLPLGQLTFTAKIPSSASGQTVTWSLVPQNGDVDPLGSITPGTDTSTAVYKAPSNDDITVTPKSVTVKACVKPDANSQPVCGTAQVTVPKMQFYITSPKTEVAEGETVRLTAFVFGSSQSRKIDWKLDSPVGGSLTPVSEDTLQADLVAPDFSVGFDVKACFQDSKDFCSNSIHLVVQSVTLQGITALWNAGTTAQYTITGTNFGTHPTVQFSASMPATVTSATDTQIQGVVVIPVAMGGQTTKFNVTVTQSNGDSETAFWTTPITIAPATVKISPTTGQLHAGETLQFTPICLTATAAACTSPETVTWQASPGSIDQTGKYTAPATVASNTTATVSACWGGPVCAPSAQVTLVPADVVVVTVSPGTATIQAGPGHTQLFSAQVTGSTNTAVTWSLSPSTSDAGSIAQNGQYTAPAALGSVTTVTVIATSQADATKHGNATVTLTAPPPQPTVTITPSPAAAVYGTPLTWTAHANGGDPATLRYAFFRRRVGVAQWTPDVTIPAWQAGNVFTWTPAAADIGTWEILVWVKDGNTPANANAYGYAGSANAGPVRIVAPLSFVVTPSPASAPFGSPITWTVTVNGGDTVTLQYAFFRRHAGTTPWIPDITAPSWQTSNVLVWTPVAADAGSWEILIEAKDITTPASSIPSVNPGPVVIVAPLSLTVTPSPAYSTAGNAITWTATANGGDPNTRQYAFFRRRSGTTPWIPDVSTPNWQPGNTFSWTPAANEVDTWEIVFWVKDGTTPANANGNGYAAYANAGPVQVVAPLTLTSTPTSPTVVTAGTTLTWTASSTGGVPGTVQYTLGHLLSGTSNWLPSPLVFQSGNVLTWTPTAADVGTWTIGIGVRDSLTPPTMNTFGVAASVLPGTVKVVAPITSLTTTPSPSTSPSGTTINWTATANGGDTATLQYAFFRRRVGAPQWTPDVSTPNWQPGNSFSWTPTANDAGTWEIVLWVKDASTPASANGYGYAAYANAGTVQVYNPITLTSTRSPSSANYGTAITWTATPSGGTPGTFQYALFRRRLGTSPWTPDVSAPNWQTSNVLSWTPTSADTGTWEIVLWVKDANTPSTLNGNGYGAYYNAGTVQVVAPLSMNCPASPSPGAYGSAFTWTVSTSGGDPSSIRYALFRRRLGTTPWTPDVSAPNWQTSNVLSWTPGSADAGTWEIIIWVKDANTPASPGYIYCNPGTVQVYNSLSLTSTGSPSSAVYGTTVNWTANGGGGDAGSYQYALFRRRLGTSPWTPDVSAPNWQPSNVLSWTPTSADTGTWEIILWVKDAYTPATQNNWGYGAYHNAGTLLVTAPLSLSATPSPSSSPAGTTLQWTATASGGNPATTQYALFRRRSGDSAWTPDVSSPAWQSSNVLSWTPGAGDVGTWEIVVWVKDGATPSTMNGYGFAAYYNAMPVQITP